MGRRRGRVVTFLVVLVVSSGAARAQAIPGYYPGYERYGWSGWQGPVPRIVALGVGYFATAEGPFKRQLPIGAGVDADTVLRWNQWIYRAQQASNERAERRGIGDRAADDRAREAKRRRVLEHPTRADINGGAALNALLDRLTEPSLQGTSLRKAQTRLSGESIRNISFFTAPQAAATLLAATTAEDAWPKAFRGEGFKAERDAYADAVGAVLKDAVGRSEPVKPGTRRELRSALRRIRTKLGALPHDGPLERTNLWNHYKWLVGVSRMLEEPPLEPVLAGLEGVKETTTGHLLAFMLTFNLRFGPATTPQGQAVYQALYADLAALRDTVETDTVAPRPDETKLGLTLGDRALPDIFAGIDLEDLERLPRREVSVVLGRP